MVKGVELVGCQDGMLAIRLSERIDTSNANAIEREIQGLLESYPGTTGISVDAEGLKYISSAGLRILLGFKKKMNHVELINVNRDVYDILDMTGFTNLVGVSRAMRAIGIDGLPCIGHGATAKVYRLNEEQIVKVFEPTISFDMVENEFRCTKAAFTAGVPAVIPFEIVRSGESYAVIYELLECLSLPDFIHQHEGEKPAYIQRYVDFVRDLKDYKIDRALLPSMKENYHALIAQVADSLEPQEEKAYHSLIDRIPDGDSFVHGDCHMGNIMVQNGEFVLIDMASVGYGDSFFELFNVYSPYHFIVENMPAGAVADMLSFSPEECTQIWEVFWDDYSRGWKEEDKALVLKQCELYATMKGVINALMLPGLVPEEVTNGMRKAVMEGVSE